MPAAAAQVANPFRNECPDTPPCESPALVNMPWRELRSSVFVRGSSPATDNRGACGGDKRLTARWWRMAVYGHRNSPVANRTKWHPRQIAALSAESSLSPYIPLCTAWPTLCSMSAVRGNLWSVGEEWSFLIPCKVNWRWNMCGIQSPTPHKIYICRIPHIWLLTEW